MKKTSLILLTMIFAFSFFSKAQNPTDCKLSAKFEFKNDKCNVDFYSNTDAGKGTTIKSYSWNFGDNTTGNVKDPKHVYAKSGVYNVCLTVVGVNAAGKECKDNICRPVTVKGCGIDSLTCKLSAKFDYKVDSCTVNFKNASGAGIGTNITNWLWTFGDGDSSIVKDPSAHVYKKSGHYNVCLTISGVNAAGQKCRDKVCREVDVKGCGIDSSCKLSAKFEYKVDSCTVNFKNTTVSGTTTKITSWLWTFGDGDSSTVKDPLTHVYKKSGHYNVCLTITGVNAAGQKCRDKECREVDVKGCGIDSTKCRLSAKFRYKIDSCTVTFTDSSKAGAGSSITGWFWTFGDGDSSKVKNPTHVYKKSGKYGVCLTITGLNAAGMKCVDKECRAVIVKGCGPIIDTTKCKLSAEYKFKVKDCSVTFAGSGKTAPGSKITSWSWHFGDGTTANVQNPTHVYTHSGHFMACLTIESVNAAGKKCVDTKCHGINVKSCGGNDSTKCRLSAKFDYKTDSCTATFTNKSNAGAGTTITNTFWTFGDGDTTSVKNPTHVYKYSGHYMACLTIVGVNAAGQKCKDRECHEIDIKGCGKDSLKCDVSAKFDYKIDSNKVSFTDASVAGPGTKITKWFWTFGDGDTSSVKNPVHKYTKAGQHKVCLVVVGVDAAGRQCKDMDCSTLKTTYGKREMASSIEVYPNPAKDMINISFNMAVEGQASVTITDLQGRTLFVIKDGYFDAGAQNLNWNVGVPSGLYLLTLKSNAGIEHKQLFIQK